MISPVRRVILDCDPGVDDALALVYLAGLHHEGAIDLEAVTTTSGNVEAWQCAVNAAWVLAQCGLRTIPLAAGCSAPLHCELTTTPETHGDTGLGYVTAPQRNVETDWDMLWCDAIERGTADLDLVITGPLTNLAEFRRLHPDHFARLERVTIMGGAVDYPGNTTETAEWNFWVDPHAAKDVLANAPVPYTLCSLGVTEQMVLGPAECEAVVTALGPTPIAGQIPDILRFYFEFHDHDGIGYLAQVHDLLTVQVALGAVKVRTQEAALTVATGPGEEERGTCTRIDAAPTARLVTWADTVAAHAEFLRSCRVLASFFGETGELDRARHARAED